MQYYSSNKLDNYGTKIITLPVYIQSCKDKQHKVEHENKPIFYQFNRVCP